MGGKFIKGALVEFMETFLLPLPNVTVFQFNPEKITHTWTPAQRAASGKGGNPLATSGNPGESFSLSIQMDAGDMIADGGEVAGEIAQVSGIYSRLAALEMLLYPTKSEGGIGSLLGSASISVSVGSSSFGAGASASAEIKRPVPQSQVPTVLFVWGPGRILPVRVTGLTITEILYDNLLSPIHAEAQLNLQVLTPEELESVNGPLKELAKGAYSYSQALREVLAIANLANAAESIIGMLPI